MISLCIIVLTLDGAMQLHALMQKDKWSHTATASSVIFPFNTLLHANERICKKDKESVVQSSLTRLFTFIFRLWTATTTAKKLGVIAFERWGRGKRSSIDQDDCAHFGFEARIKIIDHGWWTKTTMVER